MDETDLGLGKKLESLYGDVVYPGHDMLAEVPRRTPDNQWLEVVGERDLVVITRDKKIRSRKVERQMWIDRLVRGFVLTGRSSQSTEKSLKILKALDQYDQVGHRWP